MLLRNLYYTGVSRGRAETPQGSFLVDGIQHSRGRSLDDFVLKCCNRERALPPVRLRYISGFIGEHTECLEILDWHAALE
jgi:hypothetical protein